MLHQADFLLLAMKQQTDGVVAADQQLQQLLTWVNQKSCALNVSYKPAVVRAFYLDLAFTRVLDSIGGTFDVARALDRDLTCNLARPLALDMALNHALGLNSIIKLVSQPHHVVVRVLERALNCARAFEPHLEQSLQQLIVQLPNVEHDTKTFNAWWQEQGQDWIEQLRAVTIECRNIGYNWPLHERQIRVLKQYCDANQLLVDCLSSCYVTGAVRDRIEQTLLLPIEELETLSGDDL